MSTKKRAKTRWWHWAFAVAFLLTSVAVLLWILSAVVGLIQALVNSDTNVAAAFVAAGGTALSGIAVLVVSQQYNRRRETQESTVRIKLKHIKSLWTFMWWTFYRHILAKAATQ